MNSVPPSQPAPQTGRAYWRSLDDLADRPAFRAWMEKEFPSGVSLVDDPVTRRHFMKLMSASFLLAGLGMTGCRRPVETVEPFAKQPENYVHGVPQYYATAFPSRGSAQPLLVKSSDGRPTKIEGNPLYPDGNGATDAFAQASLLGLYDPDRAMRYLERGQARTREQAQAMLADLAKTTGAKQGEGLAMLLERSGSPTLARLQEEISRRLPQARWFVHEPVDFDIHRAAATLAFGQPVAPFFKLDAAHVIVALDCDFLGGEEDTCQHTRRFAKGRRAPMPGQPMNRLYAVEPAFSLTGANADHRLRLPAGQVAAFTARLAEEVLKLTGKFPELAPALHPLAQGAQAHEKWIVPCAKDLVASAGASLVMAGYRQPQVVHLLAHLTNAALGNTGKTVALLPAQQPKSGSLTELTTLLRAGKVETLAIAGANPAYNAPAALDWKQAQSLAKTVVRLGSYEDETALGCTWHLPQAHYLESWGDARTADGTVVPVQPLIDPLFDGMTALEFLARIGGQEKSRAHELVRETFSRVAPGGEEAWKKFLHDGFLTGSAWAPVSATLSPSAITAALTSFRPPPVPSTESLEVVFTRSHSTDDGRFNNNGWLMESPDPITKLTWDNAILLSPRTAAALGFGALDAAAKENPNERGLFFCHVGEISVDGFKVSGPVWIQPGMADNVLALSLGYGREHTGRIGRLADGTPAGFNAFSIKATASHFASHAQLARIPGITRQLACTQEHGAMEGRALVREASLEDFKAHPDFAHHMDLDAPEHSAHIRKDAAGRPLAIHPRPALTGMHQWGMVIDLTACVGCTACALACQSENNVPIVGKEQVAKGREMSWLRLDRYFTGGLDDPQIASQPVFCLHCENAPCENVCPVHATSHDQEGLNVMTYNRCVGTRYCSNNCPYKVRRFNYFDYQRRPLDHLYRSPFSRNPDGQVEAVRWLKDPDKGTKPADEWDLLKLARNPDVTVRMRGVMEKCTYCTQRIEQARMAKRIKARATGDVRLTEQDRSVPRTACQQACPAAAIAFGDLADPTSQVSQWKKQPQNYSLLGFLDTQPRTTYLARIRNPNPAMPDFDAHPRSLQEYMDRHGSPLVPAKGGA
jgi:molybdopterin-containing oxidoreductase family iron-sulfur binding subunit